MEVIIEDIVDVILDKCDAEEVCIHSIYQQLGYRIAAAMREGINDPELTPEERVYMQEVLDDVSPPTNPTLGSLVLPLTGTIH